MYNFFEDIDDLSYIFIFICDSLCRLTANQLNTIEERKIW